MWDLYKSDLPYYNLCETYVFYVLCGKKNANN